MRSYRFVIAFVASVLLTSTPVSPSWASNATAPTLSPIRDHAQAPLPTLALVAPAQPQSVLREIDVEVTIQSTTNLAAFEFELVYDRSLVQVTGITVKSLLGKTLGCDCNTDRCVRALGPLDFADRTKVGAFSFGSGAGANGDGLLAVLHLQPTGAEGTASLEIANALVIDTAANRTTPASQGATVTLVNPPQTFEHNTYLPLIVQNVDPFPDLVIDNIVATSNAITLTIRNQGRVPVEDAFWIDVYFFNYTCPVAVPRVNRPWHTIANAGIVFGIEQGQQPPLNLPIGPGETRDLTLNQAFFGEYGSSPPPYPVGVYVYAVVDSVDFSTDHGAVLESNEENNLFGPTTAARGTESISDLNMGGSGAGGDLPSRVPN